MSGAAGEEWIEVMDANDIDEDDVARAEVAGRVLAIYRVDGTFYATDGICTHEAACLSEGFVFDGVIECPLHQGRFDIRSGKALSPPVSRNLATYPVKVEGTTVFVRV